MKRKVTEYPLLALSSTSSICLFPQHRRACEASPERHAVLSLLHHLPLDLQEMNEDTVLCQTHLRRFYSVLWFSADFPVNVTLVSTDLPAEEDVSFFVFCWLVEHVTRHCFWRMKLCAVLRVQWRTRKYEPQEPDVSNTCWYMWWIQWHFSVLQRAWECRDDTLALACADQTPYYDSSAQWQTSKA